MPFSDHNKPELIDRIVRQSADVKSHLRELVIFAKKKSDKDGPPKRLIEALKKDCYLLSGSILEYTVRHDYVNEEGEVVDSIRHTVFQELNEVAKDSPHMLTSDPVDEFAIYSDFGFTHEEYEQLLIAQKSLIFRSDKVDFSAAFDHFVEQILKNEKHEEDWRKYIPAATGLIGIAGDIVGFHIGGLPTTLYFSCSSGMLSIAGAFKTVKDKLFSLLKK